MIKIVFIGMFLLILFSLGSALFHLVKHKSEQTSEKTLKALTFRIGLSIVLFIVVIISIATGLFKPHGIGTRIHSTTTTTQETQK
jgi:glycerol uptake facilitator-like aquaporin